jgi:hypothetical protein
MNIQKKLSLAALALLAAIGAHAEPYEGVHPLTTVNSRAAVSAQGVTAAHGANPWADGASSGVEAIAGQRDRASVRAEATAAAHAPNQNLYPEAFVNSKVPAQFDRSSSATRQAGL